MSNTNDDQLVWTRNENGAAHWEAPSGFGIVLGGNPWGWVILLADNGRFSAWASAKSLMRAGDPACFASLAEAQTWCEQRERELRAAPPVAV